MTLAGAASATEPATRCSDGVSTRRSANDSPMRRRVVRSALAASITDFRSQAGDSTGSSDSARYGSTPPSSLTSGCAFWQESRWSWTAIISSASSAPSTKPEANSRTRSHLMAAISGHAFLGTGGRRRHGHFVETNELVAKRGQSEPYSALDRAEGGVRAFGDLSLGQAIEIGKLEDVALSGRQSRHGAPNLLGINTSRDFRPDIGEGESGGHGLVGFLADGHACPLTAHCGNGAVPHDGKQPASHAALVLSISRGIAPHAQERILDDIFGQPRLAIGRAHV